jgi:hypothetical protein
MGLWCSCWDGGDLVDGELDEVFGGFCGALACEDVNAVRHFTGE